mgnify:CR=1 FL=1
MNLFFYQFQKHTCSLYALLPNIKTDLIIHISMELVGVSSESKGFDSEATKAFYSLMVV